MTMRFKFPTEDEIRVRAYRIYLARGGDQGHAEDDWLQAEYELVHLPLYKLAKLDAAIVETETAQNHKLFDLTRESLQLKWRAIWNQPIDSSQAMAA